MSDNNKIGASPTSSDRATAVEPVPVSPLRDGIADALLALAERCEAATGADRELDRRIELAMLPERVSPDPTVPLLAYTASIDAALSLVPEGCTWLRLDSLTMTVAILGDGEEWATHVDGRATTPALALCAAALRARAAQGGVA